MSGCDKNEASVEDDDSVEEARLPAALLTQGRVGKEGASPEWGLGRVVGEIQPRDETELRHAVRARRKGDGARHQHGVRPEEVGLVRVSACDSSGACLGYEATDVPFP